MTLADDLMEPVRDEGDARAAGVITVRTSPKASQPWRGSGTRNGPMWSKDSAIAALKAWAEQHGRTPKQIDLGKKAEPRTPSAGTLKTLFGSLTEAQKAAGLKTYERPKRRKRRKSRAVPATALPASKVVVTGETIIHLARVVGQAEVELSEARSKAEAARRQLKEALEQLEGAKGR